MAHQSAYCRHARADLLGPARLLELTRSSALRFNSRTHHPGGNYHPALIALVSDPSGAPIAVHRTFLTSEGRKGAVMPVKASLGPVWHGAVRLCELIPGTPVVIGEGIETSASAGLMLGLPAWAAVSAGNLATGLLLPHNARNIIIAADPDPHGRKAASAAWLRWHGEDRDVRIAMPDGDGDFNELLLSREMAHV